ncbi:MAG: DUF3060 domain-containing protein [Tahibacter sp.]
MRITRFAALVSISVLASSAAFAQDKQPGSQPQDNTSHFCVEDEAYTLSSNNSSMHLSGPCTDVTVSGSGNTVLIDLSSSIHVSGNDNKVEWVAVLGKTETPVIQNNGRQNTVKHAGDPDR